MGRLYCLKAETGLEEQIVSSDIFRQAADWGEIRGGHPEGRIGDHIEHILQYIDRSGWDSYRPDLRLLALLHDLGKPFVTKDPSSPLRGKSHAQISEEIAKAFLSETRLTRIIRYHDKHHSFFRQAQCGRLVNKSRFIGIYSEIDLPLMVRFNYADNCDRSTESVIWFEDRICEFGVADNKLYLSETQLILNK